MQLTQDDRQEIKNKIESAKRRQSEFREFIDKKCTVYPLKINITAAFENGSKYPQRSYSNNDFDFNNTQVFNFKEEGSCNIEKHIENKITLIAINSDFNFEFSGFEKLSEKRIDVRHVWFERDKN